jgi:hypothetical protein
MHSQTATYLVHVYTADWLQIERLAKRSSSSSSWDVVLCKAKGKRLKKTEHSKIQAHLNVWSIFFTKNQMINVKRHMQDSSDDGALNMVFPGKATSLTNYEHKRVFT